MLVSKRDYLSRLPTLLVFLILNGMAKTKLAILPFLCCGELVKNSTETSVISTVSSPNKAHVLKEKHCIAKQTYQTQQPLENLKPSLNESINENIV